MPQFHITMILMSQTFDDGQDVHMGTYLVIASFFTSLLSAVFGIAKLLKNGPIKLVRKDGKIGGYATPGFILLMVVVACNMIGKIIWIGQGRQNVAKQAWMWALTCILPQALLVKSQNYCLLLENNPIFFRPFQYGW